MIQLEIYRRDPHLPAIFFGYSGEIDFYVTQDDSPVDLSQWLHFAVKFMDSKLGVLQTLNTQAHPDNFDLSGVASGHVKLLWASSLTWSDLMLDLGPPDAAPGAGYTDKLVLVHLQAYAAVPITWVVLGRALRLRVGV